MSKEQRARDFSILTQTIADAFNFGDHINPEYASRAKLLSERYRGRYFESDYIRKMYELRRDTDYANPAFWSEIESIVDKIMSKEIEAIRSIAEVERQMLHVEMELIKIEAEASIQRTLNRALERFDQLQQQFADKATPDNDTLVQDMSDLRRNSAQIHDKMTDDFKAASVIPPAERLQSCRRHMSRVRDIIQSLVYKP